MISGERATTGLAGGVYIDLERYIRPGRRVHAAIDPPRRHAP